MRDVIIIGGGPAGSVLGCYLSMAGIDNMIIESANHPRDHVGESLVTSTMIVLKEIGMLGTMEEMEFVRKLGASWHAPMGREASHNELSIRFRQFPQEGIEQDYTYHVDRGKFDHLLLKRAEALGSKVYQGVHAKQVLFEDGHAAGVRVAIGGQEVDLKCKVVVDASGRQTLLGRQLKLKKKDPIFNQYAVHAWFTGVNRGQELTEDYIHIYFLPIERGWVWQIPITEEITSMGVVADKNVLTESRSGIEDFFFNNVNSNPDLARAMKEAVRINEFKTEGDYSYSMEKLVGDGYLLVGDAARFVDPIFSSGVSVAMFSAKFASETIRKAFEMNDFSEVAFLPYQAKLRQGVEIWYEFIRIYYKLLPLFTHFIQSDKYRLDVMKLLQGLVFDRTEVPVLDAMRNYIAKVEATDRHLFKGQLADIPID